jgi:hypothetical protein
MKIPFRTIRSRCVHIPLLIEYRSMGQIIGRVYPPASEFRLPLPSSLSYFGRCVPTLACRDQWVPFLSCSANTLHFTSRPPLQLFPVSIDLSLANPWSFCFSTARVALTLTDWPHPSHGQRRQQSRSSVRVHRYSTKIASDGYRAERFWEPSR